MHIEYEERILEINEKDIILKIEALKGKKVGEWFQKRYVYDFVPKRENQWIRLRTNGEKTTLTYKNIEKNSIDGTKELEIEVSEFNETNELLNVLGYIPKAYQENKRVRYIINDVELDIDSWPKIPTYLEIEGESIEKVREVEKLLELDKNKITNLNCEDIYKQIYKIDLYSIKELKF